MLPALLLLALAQAAPAAPMPTRITVEGTVHTPAGRSYGEIEVAESFALGAGDTAAIAPFSIDQRGFFVGSAEVLDGQVTVFAIARGGALAGRASAAVPPAQDGKRPPVRGLDIELRPARRVVGTLRVPEPEPVLVGGYPLAHAPLEFLLLASPTGAHVGDARATPEGKLDLYLPEGDYSWWSFGRTLVGQNGSFRVRPGAGFEDLGVLEFRLNRLGELQGKPAPELSLTAVVGAAPPPTLASLRGSWAVLAFVSMADESSFGRSLPRLVELADELGPSGALALVAIHAPVHPDASALGAALEKLAAERWPGRPTPFTLAIDHEGDTVSRYGIESYPSAVLLTPEGELAGSGDLLEIVLALRRELGAAAQKAAPRATGTAPDAGGREDH